MDTKEIQRLLDYIAKSPLAEVSIETEGLKVSVKKFGEAAPVVSVVAAAPATTKWPAASASHEELFHNFRQKVECSRGMMADRQSL